MLEIIELCKTYDKVPVLDHISLKVAQGDTFGFIGLNGAGKTTTIKSIFRFVFPDSGSILFNGKPTNKRETLRQIGYLPEAAQFPGTLTAREFLKYSYSFYGKSSSSLTDKINALIEDVGLELSCDKRIRTYSKGMKQRLGIAQAVIHDPELVILDEPFTGLDPLGRSRLKNIIKTLNQSGKTIFFSSHNLGEVQDLCSAVGILHRGRIVYQGTTHDFVQSQNSDSLQDAFLSSITNSA